METTRLGTTGLEVSRLGFGGFAIGGNRTGNSYGPTDDETSVAAVRTALELGCTFFDTAACYGAGHGEAVMGRALDCRLGRDAVVATKVVTEGGSPGQLRSDLDASLRRLGRDVVDVYLLHDPALDVITDGEALGTLADLQRQGKIRAFGASVHSVAEVDACVAFAGLGCVEVAYNLLSMLEPARAMDQVFATCRAAGVGVIAREPLAAGFLSGRHTATTEYGPGDIRGAWSTPRHQAYVALADSLGYLAGPDATMAQAALRFVLDEDGVDTTIVGIKTPEQARENLAAWRLPPFDALEAAGRARVAVAG